MGWPLILSLAFVLRLAGIHYGLPFLYHQDEPILVNHALSVGAGGWNTHFFVLPPFLIYFLFAIYGVYYVLGTVMGLFGSALDLVYAFAADPTPFYLAGRFFTGVLFGNI